MPFRYSSCEITEESSWLLKFCYTKIFSQNFMLMRRVNILKIIFFYVSFHDHQKSHIKARWLCTNLCHLLNPISLRKSLFSAFSDQYNTIGKSRCKWHDENLMNFILCPTLTSSNGNRTWNIRLIFAPPVSSFVLTVFPNPSICLSISCLNDVNSLKEKIITYWTLIPEFLRMSHL